MPDSGIVLRLFEDSEEGLTCHEICFPATDLDISEINSIRMLKNDPDTKDNELRFIMESVKAAITVFVGGGNVLALYKNTMQLGAEASFKVNQATPGTSGGLLHCNSLIGKITRTSGNSCVVYNTFVKESDYVNCVLTNATEDMSCKRVDRVVIEDGRFTVHFDNTITTSIQFRFEVVVSANTPA